MEHSDERMKTILVLAEHPGSAEAVSAALDAERYRVVHRTNMEEAEPLLVHGLASLCVLDLELSGVQALWLVEQVHRRAPRCPVLVLAGSRLGEWEEEAYLHGVTQVVSKPLRPRLFRLLVERLLGGATAAETGASLSSTEFLSLPAAGRAEAGLEASAPPGRMPSFELLRKFSGILTHSLDAEGLVKDFLLLLREIFSINRGVVFLRQPAAAFGGLTDGGESRRLHAVGALGVTPTLLEHLELSLDSGAGGQLRRLGRILRRSSEEIRHDPEALKEFELLGAQVAVPVLDRVEVVGAAFFDGRVTGEPLVNSELELIFHLLEQLALAVRNIWLHDQLAANHALLADVLRELSSACVVVSRDLAVLHANKAARRFFSRPGAKGELAFGDLPPALGSKVYQVLKTGAALAPFRFEPESSGKTVLYVSVVPLQGRGPAQTNSALLVAEDRTQSEQLRRLELETANLRLIKNMADRLAHEIGNALVPLSTHQQLLDEKYKDAEFRASLSQAMAEGVKRVSRLINQMRFLARDSVVSAESVPLATLIQEAYAEAQKHQPTHRAALHYQDADRPVVLTGDRAALKHALAEVFLNALQANPDKPQVDVRLCGASNGGGTPTLQIEVQDSGSGFAPDVAQQAATPFFTTRNVGLGLGLAVARKILETHNGKLEIVPTPNASSGLVRLYLPMSAPTDS